MQRQMVQCEDGRQRQARIYGIPREEGVFTIYQAGVRVKGKHVTGEAWFNRKSGIWYFFSAPDGKNPHLLPRRCPKPECTETRILRSPSIRTF
ncbi:MAG: hypothetical protein JRJ78_13505 [Deltaproteobacteria bacterium]|nr:hypothetical protein [Deltaproteobacteria bacterium]